jgi:hypothetical protein
VTRSLLRLPSPQQPQRPLDAKPARRQTRIHRAERHSPGGRRDPDAEETVRPCAPSRRVNGRIHVVEGSASVRSLASRKSSSPHTPAARRTERSIASGPMTERLVSIILANHLYPGQLVVKRRTGLPPQAPPLGLPTGGLGRAEGRMTTVGRFIAERGPVPGVDTKRGTRGNRLPVTHVRP